MTPSLEDVERRYDGPIPEHVRTVLAAGSSRAASHACVETCIAHASEQARDFLAAYRQWRDNQDAASALRDNFRYWMRRRRVLRAALRESVQ